jgi:hypothetical protein
MTHQLEQPVNHRQKNVFICLPLPALSMRKGCRQELRRHPSGHARQRRTGGGSGCWDVIAAQPLRWLGCVVVITEVEGGLKERWSRQRSFLRLFNSQKSQKLVIIKLMRVLLPGDRGGPGVVKRVFIE